MVLKLINNMTKQEFQYLVYDIKDSKNFYHFSIRLKGVEPEGEFTYYLYDDDERLLASSLLQVGDYKPNNTVYTTDNNGYKYYQG